MQTQPGLRRRIDKVLRKKEVSDSRKAHEKFLNHALSLGPGQKQPRGQPGKKEHDGQPDKQPKRTAKKDAKGASGGGDGGNADDRVREVTSNKDRVIKGLAAQVKELGGTPRVQERP